MWHYITSNFMRITAMLLEFSCSNHKSIRKEILFSALAGTDDTHKEKLSKLDIPLELSINRREK